MAGDTEKEILKIVETALNRENDAEELYRHGAELALRPEICDLFTKLADEERKHAELLTEVYRDVKKRLGLKILHDDDEGN